jgi:alkyl hydroperoxide reductase subunit AhpC
VCRSCWSSTRSTGAPAAASSSTSIDLYQQELAEFRDRGTELLGISVDSVYSHGAWALMRGITFPLLADFHPKGEVVRRYSVWREQDGYSDRALYVVDGTGVIRYSTVAPRLDYVPDLDELLQAVDDVHGVQAAGHVQGVHA